MNCEVSMKSILWTVSFLLFSVGLFSTGHAAISASAKNALKSTAILRGSGAIHGGLAGKGFSLLQVKNLVAKSNQLERLTVAYGDVRLKPYQGAPGYFHIENNTRNKRVVINFRQTLTAQFDEKVLQKAFASSSLVRTSQMMFDPETQSLSFVLQMKKPVSVRAVPVPGKGKRLAQLHIDLFDDSFLQKGQKSK